MPILTDKTRAYRHDLMQKLMERQRVDALIFTSADFFQWATNFHVDVQTWERPIAVCVPLSGEPFAIMKKKMRWVVILLCFLAIAVNYIDRANLAVAAPQIEKALGIGPAEMGFILSGFFWTYALMQMPFGWFVDRVGARIALPLAVGWWSVFTAATAVTTSVAGMRAACAARTCIWSTASSSIQSGR